jgi:hypothetical protein
MNGYAFTLSGAGLVALPSGALWWDDARLVVVSDLHLGKSERMARRGGPLLPPYEVSDTLERLDAELTRTGARSVICLGDSFDDLEAAGLEDSLMLWLLRMMAGRRWIWVEGNHDPGPVAIGGEHRAEVAVGPLVFRHVALSGATGEVSGHYHPKAQVAGVSRPCFLIDRDRVILPAFGTYTGGLRSQSPALAALMGEGARAVLTGRAAVAVPMPRKDRGPRSARDARPRAAGCG